MNGLATWKVKIIGINVLSLVITFLFAPECTTPTSIEFLIAWGICILVTSVLWLGNSAIFEYFHRKFPLINQTGKRAICIVAGCIPYTLVSFGGISMSIHHLQYGEMRWSEFWLDLKLSVLFTILIVLMHEAFYFFRQWQETYLDAERLKKENVQAQLDSLRNQVNPHFLFNSLNTLISIIPDCPKTAVDFTQKLSNVYRYLLNVRDKELVTLGTELDFINSYLFLLSVRFGENLKVEVNVPEHARSWLLPPVSIQMLLENAIKHNVVSRERPLSISIYTQHDFVIVKNNLQPKQQKEESIGIGLENIRKRYSILSNKSIEVNTSAINFTVALPLLQVSARTHP